MEQQLQELSREQLIAIIQDYQEIVSGIEELLITHPLPCAAMKLCVKIRQLLYRRV